MARSDRQGAPRGPDEQAGDTSPTYSGERVRQGYIALNTPLRRRVFLFGLIGFVVLVLLGALLT